MVCIESGLCCCVHAHNLHVRLIIRDAHGQAVRWRILQQGSRRSLEAFDTALLDRINSHSAFTLRGDVPPPTRRIHGRTMVPYQGSGTLPQQH